MVTDEERRAADAAPDSAWSALLEEARAYLDITP
jgi:hypothetical protein